MTSTCQRVHWYVHPVIVGIFKTSLLFLTSFLVVWGGSFTHVPSLFASEDVPFFHESVSGSPTIHPSASLPRKNSALQYRLVNSYPHDSDAFTQGLIYDNGYLLESTGLNGKSTLRKVELKTGKVLQKLILPQGFFGEGLVRWHNVLIQLTWRSGMAFVYDKETFSKQNEFTYSTEGWGITQDGTSLIMSDGTSVLRFRNPDTFLEERKMEVRDQGVPVENLNELEYVKGEIFANIWGSDLVAKISPRSGEVLGWIDLSGLRNELSPVQRVDVLNGIAYDAGHDRLFVTGKYWPKVFEIELVPISDR